MTFGPSDLTVEVLKLSLQTAVPLWIDQLRRQPWSHIEARARICGQVVAEKGDVIQFKSNKKGETAEAFNRLAEGVACLAFAPGGVRFMDLRFQAHHPDSDGVMVAFDALLEAIHEIGRAR